MKIKLSVDMFPPFTQFRNSIMTSFFLRITFQGLLSPSSETLCHGIYSQLLLHVMNINPAHNDKRYAPLRKKEM